MDVAATGNNVDEALTWILTNGERLSAEDEEMEEDVNDDDGEDDDDDDDDEEEEDEDEDESQGDDEENAPASVSDKGTKPAEPTGFIF